MLLLLPQLLLSRRDSIQQSLKIFVDADSCPMAIKEVLYRASVRVKVPLVLVANKGMRVPVSGLIELIVVADGPDAADDKIVEMMSANDIVITDDVPLAARAVDKNGFVIGTRGEIFDNDSIHEQLTSRNLMEELRSSGVQTSGPKPQTSKHIQKFSNQLDKTLTKFLTG